MEGKDIDKEETVNLTEDEKRRWKEFRDAVEALSKTKREKKRTGIEFALFEERGWEKYVLLLAEIMKAAEESGLWPFEGGSSCDSYVLRKYVTGNEEEDKAILQDGRGRQILLNDALRLNWFIDWPHNDHTEETIRRIDRVLDPIVKSSGLHIEQKLFSYSRPECDENLERKMVEYLILSPEPIPGEDVDLILNEKRESTTEEAGRLRKYLLMKVTAVWYRGQDDRGRG